MSLFFCSWVLTTNQTSITQLRLPYTTSVILGEIKVIIQIQLTLNNAGLGVSTVENPRVTEVSPPSTWTSNRQLTTEECGFELCGSIEKINLYMVSLALFKPLSLQGER